MAVIQQTFGFSQILSSKRLRNPRRGREGKAQEESALAGRGSNLQHRHFPEVKTIGFCLRKVLGKICGSREKKKVGLQSEKRQIYIRK